MNTYKPAPDPPTKLGVYRVLAPTAGIHVSPLVLGVCPSGTEQARNGRNGQAVLDEVTRRVLCTTLAETSLILRIISEPIFVTGMRSP